MTRILSVILFLFLAFTVYYDLTVGSLPIKETNSKSVQTTQAADKPKIPYVEILVQPGDTVLSIYEHLSNGQTQNISIEQLIKDFETLNPPTKAAQIKIGVLYKFPTYADNPETPTRQNF